MVLKVNNRVVSCCGRYNTVAGEVLIKKSSLSSLFMLFMGFYRLLEGTHTGLDKHHSRFF